MTFQNTFLVGSYQFSEAGRPSRLVAGPQTHTIVAMKIFVEKIQMFIAGLLIKPIVFTILRHAA